MQTNHTPTVVAPLSSLDEATLSESLREQFERHLPHAKSSKDATFRRAVIKAKRYAHALNVNAAARWNQLTEGL